MLKQNFLNISMFVLLLIIGLCNCSKLQKMSLNEKWSDTDKCFIYNHVRTRNPADFYKKLGFGFLGKNLYTQESVFAVLSRGRISENDRRINLPEKYEYYNQNIVSKNFLPEKNDKLTTFPMYNYTEWPQYYNTDFFFAMLSTECKNVRNENENPPSNAFEKIDPNISFSALEFKKCHNICRTVYLQQGGRCNRVGGQYRCSYLYYR